MTAIGSPDTQPRSITDRGRDEGLTSPLPPNRTCGFPASGFPVSGGLIRDAAVRCAAQGGRPDFRCSPSQLRSASSSHCIARWALALVCLPLFCSSFFHFPASLGSTLVTRFIATMDALTPVGRLFGPLGHEHRVDPNRSPCLLPLRFLPFCLQPPSDGDVAFLSFTVSFSTRSLSRLPFPSIRESSTKEAWAAGRTSHNARGLVPSSGRIEFTLFIRSN